jgi:hypothetical protein
MNTRNTRAISALFRLTQRNGHVRESGPFIETAAPAPIVSGADKVVLAAARLHLDRAPIWAFTGRAVKVRR